MLGLDPFLEVIHPLRPRQVDDERLVNLPDIHYQAIIFVEGDKAKRKYNPMSRERKQPRSHGYRVSNRYGIWLCKDFIPIERVNPHLRNRKGRLQETNGTSEKQSWV
jgi:hypothetical protein